MLEDIRESLMSRMHKKLTEISSVTDKLYPRIRTKLESIKYNSRLCTVKPAVGEKFQVAIGLDPFVVNLKSMTCTCRVWQLSRIPCLHACANIHFMNKDTTDFVNPYFTVDTYLKAYAKGIEPTNGPNMWSKADGYAIKPPHFKKKHG